MIEEVLKLLASDIEFKTKLHLIEDAIVSYCVTEEQVFHCYRTLKHLELELSESSDECISMDVCRKVLKIIETELDILNVRMRIAQNLEDIGERKMFDFRLHWTDSKTDLVELIYSIKDSIGGGKASVKQITTCFEYFFDIKLGNIYDVINDISLRKMNRTKYIDKITVNFQKVLDQMDA